MAAARPMASDRRGREGRVRRRDRLRHAAMGGRALVGDPQAVTARSAEEVDAREVGLRRRDVAAIWEAVEGYYRTGLQPALALCVRHRGQVILDRAIGYARGGGPGDQGIERVLATPQTLFNLFSASKSITSMLIHLLVERGQVDLDAPVSRYIPGFERRGKGGITMRHVMAHRAGIPKTPTAHVDPELLSRPERIVELMLDSRPETAPGQRLAYTAVNGGFLMAEGVRQVTGQDVRSFLRQEIVEPLGFDALNYGVGPERVGEVARESVTGPPPAFPFDNLLRRSLGIGLQEAVDLSNDPRFITGIVPAGNVYATANEACRFFELLLRGGMLDGVRVFAPETVRGAVAPQNSWELDRTIGLPIRYGLGFMLGGQTMGFYGRGSAQAFGHLGFTNVLAYADPERDISVALMNNGKPLVTPELLLWLNITYTIAQRIPRVRGRIIQP